MLITGNHPIQNKLESFKEVGYSACRKCKMVEVLNTTNRPILQVYYHDNQRQWRFPLAKWTIEELGESIKALKEVPIEVKRTHISSASHVSRESIFCKLHNLYAFDLCIDLVFDLIHMLSLNILKIHIEKFIEIIEITLDMKSKIEQALQLMTSYKPSTLGSRWPKNPTNRLGYFKAKEYKKFELFCLSYMLNDLQVSSSNPELYNVGLLVISIAQLFYGQICMIGWTHETLYIAKQLLYAWRICIEEWVGPNSSILEYVASK